MATMASASTNQSNLLSNGISTNKDAQCSYCKATGYYYKSCPKLKKKKEMEAKDGTKHSAQLTHHVTHVGKRTIQPKDVGKALALTCVPSGHRQNKKSQMLQILKENLKQQATQWLLIQANPIPKRPIQKPNFATTPNTWLYVGQTIRHFRSSNSKINPKN